jgi:hypothetical protein
VPQADDDERRVLSDLADAQRLYGEYLALSGVTDVVAATTERVTVAPPSTSLPLTLVIKQS